MHIYIWLKDHLRNNTKKLSGEPLAGGAAEVWWMRQICRDYNTTSWDSGWISHTSWHCPTALSKLCDANVPVGWTSPNSWLSGGLMHSQLDLPWEGLVDGTPHPNTLMRGEQCNQTAACTNESSLLQRLLRVASNKLWKHCSPQFHYKYQ